MWHKTTHVTRMWSKVQGSRKRSGFSVLFYFRLDIYFIEFVPVCTSFSVPCSLADLFFFLVCGFKPGTGAHYAQKGIAEVHVGHHPLILFLQAWRALGWLPHTTIDNSR